MNQRLIFVGFMAGFMTFVSACNAPTSSLPVSPLLKSGNYQGNRISTVSQQLTKNLVQGAVTQNGFDYSLQILGMTPASSPFVVHAITPNQISLSGGEINLENSVLDQESDSDPTLQCFSKHGEQSIRLCTAIQEFNLEITSTTGSAFSLSMDWFDVQPVTVPEAPKVFTLDEVMNRALSQNFDTRMEFERSLQAHHAAANAYLNLLPHLTLNSILALTKPADIQNLISNIGDLAPFLLPSRWLKAKNAALFSDAEKYALALMRGDTAAMVEATAYGIHRDQAILAHYNDLIPQMEDLASEMDYRERYGKLPSGSADTVQSVINSLKNDRQSLALAQSEQNKFFSVSLGFYSPETVKEVILPEFDASQIPSTVLVNPQQVSETALKSSFELNQVDSLLEIARNTSQSVYFNWLDPSADTASQGLGFGSGEQVAIEQSKIKEILTLKEQINSKLQLNSEVAAGRFNQAIALYTDALDDLNLQERRVSRTMHDLRYGKNINLVDLLNALQDRLKTQLILETAIANYRISAVHINRFLLTGYYTHLLLGSIEPAPSPSPAPSASPSSGADASKITKL